MRFSDLPLTVQSGEIVSLTKEQLRFIVSNFISPFYNITVYSESGESIRYTESLVDIETVDNLLQDAWNRELNLNLYNEAESLHRCYFFTFTDGVYNVSSEDYNSLLPNLALQLMREVTRAAKYVKTVS